MKSSIDNFSMNLDNSFINIDIPHNNVFKINTEE